VSLLQPGEEVEHQFAKNRHGWLQVARGSVEVNGQKFSAGDGAAISDEQAIAIKATDKSEVLLFDLA
jgi:redox-sensitive bicupin YhaK (pirin superfamily)